MSLLFLLSCRRHSHITAVLRRHIVPVTLQKASLPQCLGVVLTSQSSTPVSPHRYRPRRPPRRTHPHQRRGRLPTAARRGPQRTSCPSRASRVWTTSTWPSSAARPPCSAARRFSTVPPWWRGERRRLQTAGAAWFSMFRPSSRAAGRPHVS